QEVLGGYDAKNYEARRIWAVARDGTKVPVSLVYKKGVKFAGTTPLLLIAYGSYGASMAPTFSSNRLALLDRGLIFALAHIRCRSRPANGSNGATQMKSPRSTI